MNHPGEPVDLAEEFEVKLAVLDEVVGVDDDEEPRCHVQVEGDVHHHNQHTSNLRNWVAKCFHNIQILCTMMMRPQRNSRSI